MEQEIRPYRPSNGSEGMRFEDQFCDKCKNEDVEAEEICAIHDLALFGCQPKEWRYLENKPVCTAFRDEDDKPNTTVEFKDMLDLPFQEAARD